MFHTPDKVSCSLGVMDSKATYFDVQQGASSTSISATSPVVTSTLPAATNSGSASSSAAHSTASGKNSASVPYSLNTGFAGLLAFVGIILAA